MTIENIVKELNERGYTAEKTSVNKNGVDKLAITIKNENNISPIIYYTNDMDTNKIIEIYEKHKINNVDVSKMLTSEYILNNCFVGLAKSVNENVLKKNSALNGLYEYVYIKVDLNQEPGTITINKDIIINNDIDTATLWKKAIENTCQDTLFDSMSKIMFGMESESDPFYILTNKNKIKGAGAIVNENVLRKFANRHNVNKLLILPSSIHELIIVPYTKELNKTDFDKMVKDVNKTQVSLEEQLANESFVLEF